MIYTLSQLIDDVMARMGEAAEAASPVGLSGAADLRTASERKISVLLPSLGRQLILDAKAETLAGAEHHSAEITVSKVPCGLYAADLTLPEDMVRIISVKMAGWSRNVVEVVMPGSGGYSCQWSEEKGIAGSPDRPKAYLRHERGGSVLRAIGSKEGDSLEHLLLWRVPKVDVEGKFRFPGALYAELVEKLTEEI